jgi:hypothetical protein
VSVGLPVSANVLALCRVRGMFLASNLNSLPVTGVYDGFHVGSIIELYGLSGVSNVESFTIDTSEFADSAVLTAGGVRVRFSACGSKTSVRLSGINVFLLYSCSYLLSEIIVSLPNMTRRLVLGSVMQQGVGNPKPRCCYYW